MPATFTTASSRPCSATRSSNSARTPSASVTESADARAVPPAATIRSAVVGSSVASRSAPSSVTSGSTVTTTWPVRPSSSAIAAPMPPPPPVTTATGRPPGLTAVPQVGSPRAPVRSRRGDGSVELEPLQVTRGQPGPDQVAVGEQVAAPAAVVPAPWAHRLGVTLVVDAGRRAGGHDAAGVDVGRDDLLDPAVLGLCAHVEHLDLTLLQLADQLAEQLGAEHSDGGVVDGDDGLLAGCRHDEEVREAPAHHPVEAGGAVGPLVGE